MGKSPDKTKPSVRRGRKAAGLLGKMTELMKDKPFPGIESFLVRPQHLHINGSTDGARRRVFPLPNIASLRNIIFCLG
jgi:hypothetical protein